MSVTGDFLQRPPHLVERQTTKSDVDFIAQQALHSLMSAIRDELRMQNPRVLCETQVQGGPTINDQVSHTVKFLAGGKPVTVYKVMMWTQSEKAIVASITGMSDGGDGFTIPATLTELHVPVSEMSIALNEAGTIGVNVPNSVNTDGSVFIYGFTTPDYGKEQDW